MASMARGLACVTGCTSGIGLSFAKALAQDGHDLLIAGRNGQALIEVAASISEATGRRVETMSGDLGIEADLEALGERLWKRGDLAILVNNAGIGRIAPFEAIDQREIRETVAVNVTAVAALAHAALPALKANAATLINVASGVAFAAMAGAAVYGGTKAFVAQFTRALAVELESSGCRVQALIPGLTRTNLGGAAANGFFDQFPPEWVMEPDDLVRASLAALDRGEVVCAPGVQHPELIDRAIEAMQAFGMGVSSNQVAARYRAAV